MARFIDTKNVAKLIRKELKVFKGTKFSVRISRYAGGSSIRASWVDGPTELEVNSLIGHFKGGSFDGMIDLMSYHDSNLDGEQVHFGNGFLFTERMITADLFAECRSYVASRYGSDVNRFETAEQEWDGVRSSYLVGHERFGSLDTMEVQRLIGEEIRKTSAWPVAQLVDTYSW